MIMMPHSSMTHSNSSTIFNGKDYDDHSSSAPPSNASEFFDHSKSVEDGDNELSEEHMKIKWRYRSRIPSSSALAIKEAVSKLFSEEDFIIDSNPIGVGYYATVYKVIHTSTGRIMAMKEPNGNDSQQCFNRELTLLNKLRHINILKFYGTCVRSSRLTSLTEFINGGSLCDLLRNEKVELNWRVRVHLAKDIAEGVRFLHNKNIIHRDLSSQNILIRINGEHAGGGNPSYSAVVADLGLCLNLNHERCDRTSCVGNAYYTAPECLKHIAPYSTASDVFAYGLLVCEIMTRRSNDGNLIPRTSSFGLDYFQLTQLVSSNRPDWFYRMALECCGVHHAIRPSIHTVCTTLAENEAYVDAWSSQISAPVEDIVLMETNDSGVNSAESNIHPDSGQSPTALPLSESLLRAHFTSMGPEVELSTRLYSLSIASGQVRNDCILGRSRGSSKAIKPPLGLEKCCSSQHAPPPLHLATPPQVAEDSGTSTASHLIRRRRRYSTESVMTPQGLSRRMAARDPCYVNWPMPGSRAAAIALRRKQHRANASSVATAAAAVNHFVDSSLIPLPPRCQGKAQWRALYSELETVASSLLRRSGTDQDTVAGCRRRTRSCSPQLRVSDDESCSQ